MPIDGENKMSYLDNLSDRINKTAHDKGWYDNGVRNFGESIALMHSELSEALEAWRDPTEKAYRIKIDGKPEGWAVELVDCVIRIFDLLAENNISIDHIIEYKMKYNETRPYRHGGKKA